MIKDQIDAAKDNTVKLGQLAVELDDPVKTLRPENAEFLAGRRAHPKFDSTWSGQRWLGLGMLAFAALGAAAVLFTNAPDLAFNSPLSTTVEGRFGSYRGDLTTYSYDVGDNSYSGIDKTFTRSSAPDPEIELVYLRFWPSQSRLEANLDSSVWAVVIFLLGTFGGIGLVGWYMRRYLDNITRLTTQATHVITGSMIGTTSMPKSRGVNYEVRATSPATGRPIARTLPVGRLNARFGAFSVGDNVALLYAADDCCEVL